MEIILLKTDKKLGAVGTHKNVSDGFATNFLIPQGIAIPATKSAIAQIAAKKELEEKANQEHVVAAQKLAKDLRGKKVRITAKAKGTVLFGSVTAKEIATAVNDQCKTSFTSKEIKLAQPIKEITTQEIEIDLGYDVTAGVVIDIVAE